MGLWHLIQHLTGSDDPAGAWYAFWSGFGADLGELALLGAALGLWRKHVCHVKGCWRFARQEVSGTSWRVCHRHHPEGSPTAEQVVEAHQRAAEGGA